MVFKIDVLKLEVKFTSEVRRDDCFVLFCRNHINPPLVSCFLLKTLSISRFLLAYLFLTEHG